MVWGWLGGHLHSTGSTCVSGGAKVYGIWHLGHTGDEPKAPR